MITLTRSGDAPLTFSGELLAESDGQWHTGREQNRYHSLGIYKTDAGRYVVGVSYSTSWQGEVGRYVAHVAATPAELANWLRNFDPTAHVGGFPPGDAYAEKQRRLLADIRVRWESQVSEVLADPAFHEEVDNMALSAKSFRLDSQAVETLTRLQAIHGYETQGGAVSHALACWEAVLGIASEEIAGTFSREEWCAIADACNGTLWDEMLGGRSAGIHLAANVEDAHRLNGLGEKWFGADGDKAIRELLGKLQSLDYAQGWALLRAVCWFWQHTDRDTDGKDWWTIAFRRKAGKGAKP